jgi:hypothetical protein
MNQDPNSSSLGPDVCIFNPFLAMWGPRRSPEPVEGWDIQDLPPHPCVSLGKSCHSFIHDDSTCYGQSTVKPLRIKCHDLGELSMGMENNGLQYYITEQYN